MIRAERASKPNHRGFTVGGPAARYVLVICSLLWMVSFMDRQIAAVVLEPIRAELGLGDAQASWLTTGLYLGLAGFAIPVAYLADRTSRSKAIAVMAVAWSSATLVTGLLSNPWALTLARAATGAAEAGFSAASVSLIAASTAEDRLASRLGVFNLFQVVGIAVGSVLAGQISARLGWRAAFFAFAVPGLLLGGLALTMQDYPTVRRARPGGIAGAVRELLAVRTLRWFYAGQAAFTAMAFAVLSWAPSLLIRQFGIDVKTAGLLAGLAACAALPGALLGGAWSDRWQRRHPAGRLRFAALAALVATLGLVVALAIALGLPVATVSPVLALVAAGGAFLVFCLTAAAVTPAVMAASQSVVAGDRKGLVWGLGLTLVLVCGGAWLPLVVGAVSDALGAGARGLEVALLGTGVLGVVGAGCFTLAARAYPADRERVA